MPVYYVKAPVAVRIILAFVSLWFGCTKMSREPTTLSELKQNETLVVGKIELVPPLREEEQSIHVNSPYNFVNTGYFIVRDQWQEISPEPRHSTYQGGIDATLGQHFYRVYPSRPHYVLGGSIQLRLRTRLHGRNMRQIQEVEDEVAYLPGGLMFDIRANDENVYIFADDTMRFHRSLWPLDIGHV